MSGGLGRLALSELGLSALRNLANDKLALGLSFIEIR